MSDLREAFEALNKYRKAYDEMYQMLGIFLDAEEGREKPDIDEAWSAFNLAPGPVYWKAIEAALSANGGEADIKMGTGDVLIGDMKGEDFSGVVFYRDKKTFGVGQPHPEMSGVPCDQIESRIFSVTTSNPESLMVLRRAVDRALDHLGSPAPPSVAVPEGWKLVPVEPTDDMVRRSNWSGNGDVSVNEDWARKTVWDRMIYAAPSPDHSGDEFQRGFEAGKKAIIDGGRERILELEDHIADAGKVAFVDGLGAQRMTAEECREGIEYIIHGDNIYWPLSDDDELRLIQAACGKGEFTYPGATPSVPEEEVRTDAERYRWLRDKHKRNWNPLIICQLIGDEFFSWAGDDPDTAIDNAMRLRTAGDEGEGSPPITEVRAMDKLKPCPFCGGNNLSQGSILMTANYIECYDCGAYGPDADSGDWNARADTALAAAEARIAELEELVESCSSRNETDCDRIAALEEALDAIGEAEIFVLRGLIERLYDEGFLEFPEKGE